MLTVSSHEQGDIVLVNLAGRLDGGPVCKALPDCVKDHLGSGQLHFVLDLQELEWMSSCGIGCLIATYTSVRRAGGNIVLRAPNERVLGALSITDLVPGVFDVLEGEPVQMHDQS